MVDILNITEKKARELGCYEQWKAWQDAVHCVADKMREEIDNQVLEELKKEQQ